jgi:hypothetical protein
MDTAEIYDRVHLRTTYYNYAKHLEARGDITSAVPVYVCHIDFTFQKTLTTSHIK